MIAHKHLKLKKREPVNIAVAGPSQTRIDKIVVQTANKIVYLRGDDNVDKDTPIEELGFPIVKGDPFTNAEYSSNQGIYLLADSSTDVKVDVLVVSNA